MKYTLNDFFKCADEKRISAHFNTDKTLVGFKYTPETVYSQNWDEVSLLSRGIVFEIATGKIVAFPFKKFFNFEELYESATMNKTNFANTLPKDYLCADFSGKFRVMEKYDGSLGIAFFYNGKWVVKTGGSFDSEQASWATDYLNTKCNTECLNKDFTYCFEIIYDEDVHPIHYNFEGLVLLGVIDTQTGIEQPIEVIRSYADFGYMIAKEYEFGNFANVVKFAKKRDNIYEGVVITFENGWKTKIKGEEFLKLQKLFHNISKEAIWENFDYWNEKYKDFDFIMNIPEELKAMKEFAAELPKEFEEKRSRLLLISNTIAKMNVERKVAWEMANEKTGNKTDAGIIMKMLEGNTSRYKDMIWRSLKPKKIEENSNRLYGCEKFE